MQYLARLEPGRKGWEQTAHRFISLWNSNAVYRPLPSGRTAPLSGKSSQKINRAAAVCKPRWLSKIWLLKASIERRAMTEQPPTSSSMGTRGCSLCPMMLSSLSAPVAFAGALLLFNPLRFSCDRAGRRNPPGPSASASAKAADSPYRPSAGWRRH